MATEQSMDERYPDYLEQWQQIHQSQPGPSNEQQKQQEQPHTPSVLQPSRGFAQMARSGVPSRILKKDEKYQFQFIGMVITVACAAFSIYSIYSPAKQMYDMLNANFYDNFTEASSFFPIALLYLLASYFFVKSVLFPSYAAGRNLSTNFWPLTVTGSFLHYLLMSQVFALIWLILLKSGTLTLLISVLKSLNYKPLMLTFAQFIVCNKYSHISQYGDEENYAFIKPWIVDVREKDNMNRRV